MPRTARKKKGDHKGFSSLVLACIDNFMVCRNQTQAYAAVRPGAKDSSRTASRIFARPEVQAEITRREEHLRRVSTMDAAEVINRLSLIARANIKDLCNDDWSLRPLGEIPDELAYAISSVKDTTRTSTDKAGRTEVVRTVKVFLKDSKSSLDSLAKHLGLFKDGEGGGGTTNNILAVLHANLRLDELSLDELRTLLALVEKIKPQDDALPEGEK